MPKAVKIYVRFVDAMNRRVGRFAMYLIFAMMGILLYSSISKTFFDPSLWTLEMAQFTMVAYYLLGGGYSMQLGAHVRMDLAYGFWSDKTKAAVDAFTVFFLIYFLWVLLAGGVGSTAYALGYYGAEPYAFFKDLAVAFFSGGIAGAEEVIGRLERSPTAWRPFVWPIKVTMCIGIFLMLLQTISMFFKDLAKLRGEDLS